MLGSAACNVPASGGGVSETASCIGDACSCVPICEGKAGGADGCGGTCPCADGQVLDAGGACVPDAGCDEKSCVSEGWRCGDLCGAHCGDCVDGETCISGKCECAPLCDGTRCDDGCGGVCPCADGKVCDASGACVPPDDCEGSCASMGAACGSVCGEFCGSCAGNTTCKEGACVPAVTCSDCALVLRMKEREVEGSLIDHLVLAVDYQPGESSPNPRMLDLRLRLPNDAKLTSVERGVALIKAEKPLRLDEGNGQSFRVRSDGSVQILAYSLNSTSEIEAGRLLTLSLDISHPGPLDFQLLRHEQTFAPPAADGALQATAYDTPLTVTR